MTVTSVAANPEPPPPFTPKLGAMAICNKLASTGAVSRCAHRDGGTGVTFIVNGQHVGAILVLPPERYRTALDRFESKKGELLATSDELGALVWWTSSGELPDMQVRLGLAEAEHLVLSH
jgi:hypothetical protein